MSSRGRGALVVLALLSTAALGKLLADRRTPADGSALYSSRCAICHDVDGAIGAELTPEVLASYASPAALHRYLRLAMPYEAPGSMDTEEYWAVVEHLAKTRHLIPDSVAVTDLRDETTPFEVGS